MRWPAEWEPHEAIWIGFPGDPVEWPIGLSEAQREVAAFADAVCDAGCGEQVILVCRDARDADTAKSLCHARVDVIVERLGDIWLRDTGPIVTAEVDNRIANDFRFNGWGGRFKMAGDQDIASRLAKQFDLPVRAHDWILEGGAIDGDGNGAIITTEQCLLNPNRNPGFGKNDAEAKLAGAFSSKNFIWLGDGLIADHTDGHVDNLARFVAPGVIVVPEAEDDDDPNHAIFEDAVQRALAAGLEVKRLPSVGRYEIDRAVAPASYMNFYIGNEVVAVPQYGAANDDRAVWELAALFPDRKVIGLSSSALLRGGGSFHCISQQIPML